jgi:uncharacterized LabA/DUF88 family protein
MHEHQNDNPVVEAAPKKKVHCLVDGFNLYHALDWFDGGETEEENRRYRRYKWLSLTKLAKSLLNSESDELVGVDYFTAVPSWDIGKQTRHRFYIRAQEAEGVTVTRGAFRDKDVICKASCKGPFTVRVEKQTDVNIAVKLVDLAYQNAFDKVLLISGDTDLIPAINLVRHRFPGKEVIAVLPIGKRALSADVRQACNSEIKMNEQHLRDSQLPETVVDIANKVRTLRPIEYLPIGVSSPNTAPPK